MKMFEVASKLHISPESITGHRSTPWRGKRQFRRLRGKLCGDHRKWARQLRYHPRVAISYEAYFGAMTGKYIVPQIVEAENQYIMDAFLTEVNRTLGLDEA